MSELPVIGITIGDAAGIGPEVTLKAIADERVISVCKTLVIGDAELLRRTAAEFGLSEPTDIHDLSNLPDQVVPGAKNVHHRDHAQNGLGEWQPNAQERLQLVGAIHA